MKCETCGQYHSDDMGGEEKAKLHVGMKLKKYTKEEAKEIPLKPKKAMNPKKGK